MSTCTNVLIKLLKTNKAKDNQKINLTKKITKASPPPSARLASSHLADSLYLQLTSPSNI